MRKLLCLSTVLFFLTFGYAQDTQESLIPGIYNLNLDETPLYCLPKALFEPSNRSVMRIHLPPPSCWATKITPEFGFLPAAERGIHAFFEVRPSAFMNLERAPNALENSLGTVVYPPEFPSV